MRINSTDHCVDGEKKLLAQIEAWWKSIIQATALCSRKILLYCLSKRTSPKLVTAIKTWFYSLWEKPSYSLTGSFNWTAVLVAQGNCYIGPKKKNWFHSKGLPNAFFLYINIEYNYIKYKLHGKKYKFNNQTGLAPLNVHYSVVITNDRYCNVEYCNCMVSQYCAAFTLSFISLDRSTHWSEKLKNSLALGNLGQHWYQENEWIRAVKGIMILKLDLGPLRTVWKC